MTKEEARRRAKRAVAAMSDVEKEWASGAITDALISLDVFRSCRKPFVFMSAADEPDTEAVIGLFLAMEREVSVPRVRGEEMDAVRITPYTDFKRNRWGILEPVGGMIAEDCDLAVVPVVAFDGLKRVGHGKGYYDKFLSRFPHCVKVGVAFSSARTEGVEVQPHDVHMDIIVTEKQNVTADNVAVFNEFGRRE